MNTSSTVAAGLEPDQTATHKTTTDADTQAVLADAARLRALSEGHLADSAGIEALDRFARLATRLIGVPVALVSFVDDRNQYLKGAHGLTGDVATTRQTPLSASFCKYVAASESPLRVVDAREDPLVFDNDAVADMNVIAYLGVPVRGPSGHVLASLCAIDHQPRNWSEDDEVILREMADAVEGELRLRQVLRERQLILDEMNHRVKNLFSLVSGIVRSARREADDVEDLAESIDSRLGALSEAHRLVIPMTAAIDATPSETTLGALVETLMKPYSHGKDNRIVISGPEVTVGAKAAIYLALTVHELATNASKYGALSAPGGQTQVAWTCEEDTLVLRWSETGKVWDTGQPEPAVAAPAGGFGTQLLRTCVEGQLDGKLETAVTEESYTRIVSCPLAALDR